MATVDLWMAFALSAAPRQRPRVHSLLAKKTGEGTLTAAAVAAAVAGYGGPLESLFEPLLALAQDMLSSGRLGAVVAHAQVTPLPRASPSLPRPSPWPPPRRRACPGDIAIAVTLSTA